MARRVTGPTKPLAQGEFIALMAMTTAVVAFSIDAMLPTLPAIAASVSADNPNAVQLVVTSFVLGMGLGTFVTGPLSDALGRKPVMVGGVILYCIGAIVAGFAQNLEVLLAARIVQGLGAAGPRVVAMAMIRDIYGGREMARIMSFVMIIFATVPALAPTMGFYIVLGFGWRAIFIVMMLFSLIAAAWLTLRQPETLPLEKRRPLNVTAITAAIAELIGNRTTRLSIIVQMLTFGAMFSVLSTNQQVFDITFGQGDTFHLWFGAIAILSTAASFLNARLVGRLGMRAIVRTVLTLQIGLSALMLALTWIGGPYLLSFGMFLLWTAGIFFQAGLSIGNLNALAMEPMGHIAGIAASVIAALSTVGAVLIAVPVGLAFDGTPTPMVVSVLLCSATGLWLVLKIKRPGEV